MPPHDPPHAQPGLSTGRAKRADKRRACDRFNAAHRPGETIRDWPSTIGRGAPVTVQIAAPAHVLGGHTPVVPITGRHGCIALTHVARGIGP